MRGCGGGSIDFAHEPATRLLWTGSSGGTVVKLLGTEQIFNPNSGDWVRAIEISDLTIDGNNGSAGTGLHIEQVVDSHFHDLDVFNVKSTSGGIGMKISGCSWLLFERCSIREAYDGLSVGPTNAHHNTFIQLNIQEIKHYGIFLGDSDNNTFYSVHNTQFAGADTGYAAIAIDINFVDTDVLARSNYFYHYSGGGPSSRVAVINADTPFNGSGKTLFFGYDHSNGEPQPEAYSSSTIDPDFKLTDPTPYFFWTDSMGETYGGVWH